ncbi:MAG: inositol monophosphatase family protein [Gemmatimonadales bacterium]|jgi:myo-inositol-1(or 4)-monophosphatase
MTKASIPFDRDTIAKILDAMTAAARVAEEVIRSGAASRGALVWKSKGHADYVTEVDTAAESVIQHELATALADEFPELPVLGEESWRDEPLPNGLAFIVDPLDGTTNFLHGVPAYSVSIAAIHETRPIIGVVLDIPHGELFTAVRGHGTRVNGTPARVSETSDPSRALIGTGFPFGANAATERYARQFVPIAQATAGIRRAGSAAIDLAWLATGRFDAFWELRLNPWDIAAGILLVEEAGGIVTDIDGSPATVATSPLVAGNPAMHAWLLDTLQTADRATTQ